MRQVRAAATLDCGSNVAEALIPKFFELQKDRSGTIRFTMEVPLQDFGLPTHLALAKDVVVSVVQDRDDENLNDIFRVSWSPATSGPFPDFKGKLIVWSEDDPDRGFIELIGEYEPPLSLVGEAFDAAIGYLIAQRTAERFLERVADGISALRATNG